MHFLFECPELAQHCQAFSRSDSVLILQISASSRRKKGINPSKQTKVRWNSLKTGTEIWDPKSGYRSSADFATLKFACSQIAAELIWAQRHACLYQGKKHSEKQRVPLFGSLMRKVELYFVELFRVPFNAKKLQNINWFPMLVHLSDASFVSPWDFSTNLTGQKPSPWACHRKNLIGSQL